MDQIPRFGKRELIGLLLFTCNHVVSVGRGFLFLYVLGMGYVILLWHSRSLPYNYFESKLKLINRKRSAFGPIDDSCQPIYSKPLSAFLTPLKIVREKSKSTNFISL